MPLHCWRYRLGHGLLVSAWWNWLCQVSCPCTCCSASIVLRHRSHWPAYCSHRTSCTGHVTPPPALRLLEALNDRYPKKLVQTYRCAQLCCMNEGMRWFLPEHKLGAAPLRLCRQRAW